jgi:hypothetical protein
MGGHARVSTTEQKLGQDHDDPKPAFDASVDHTEAGCHTPRFARWKLPLYHDVRQRASKNMKCWLNVIVLMGSRDWSFSYDFRHLGEWRVKVASFDSLMAWKEGVGQLFSSSLPSRSLNWPNLQPPAEGYFSESLTTDWTSMGYPATKEWDRPKTLLFSSDGTWRQCNAAMIVPSGNYRLVKSKPNV